MESKRAQWSSKIGFILAAAGSAVGLGNIWKFPGRAYEGGGGTYLLVYLLVVVFLGIPLMLTELTLGRASQSNAVGAFRALGHPRASWAGWTGVLGVFIIACYYCHVGGWVLRYVFAYAFEAPAVYADSPGYFYNMLGLRPDGTTVFPWAAVGFAAVFTALTALVLIRGVSGGIERFNKIGMPALFLLLIVLLVRAVTLPGAEPGLRYLLSFDWEKFSMETVLSALGQAFYSLSIGMAILITYGSYLPKSENIPKNTLLVCAMDTLVALLAGFIIVPAVFATLGADQVGKGGGFAFVSLAGVFEMMPGGRIFGTLFYLLLLFAALTSSVSILESVVAFLTERFGWKRKGVTIWLSVVVFAIGCLYTATQAAYPIRGIWLDAAHGVSHPAFCDFLEYLSDRLLIPLTALGCCLFVGWVWKPENVMREVERSGVRFPLRGVYRVIVKYVAPLAIGAILILSLAAGRTLS